MRRRILRRSFVPRKLDFDAWAYNIDWPQEKEVLPLFEHCSVYVEDIKFAINAWMLLRLCMFYGTEHPVVLSHLTNVTPSMDIAQRGNRLFFMHCGVGNDTIDPQRLSVALTPSHPNAQSIHAFDWGAAMRAKERGIALVLGMENGMSDTLVSRCDRHVFIPQYGSIGSLSMLNALSIAVHAAHTALRVHGGQWRCRSRCYGHQPGSHSRGMKSALPHETSLIHLSNDEVRRVLDSRRRSYPLQLALMVRNELADRNIGAALRNANIYNCEVFAVLNRKKFNRRGSVGTHHYTPTLYSEDVAEAFIQAPFLHDYEFWVVHQTHPFLVNYYRTSKLPVVRTKRGWVEDVATYIRPDDKDLITWGQKPQVDDSHPIAVEKTRCLSSAPVYFDDPVSVLTAVKNAILERRRGIALLFPEDGATEHPELVRLGHRFAYVVHPTRLAATQRGIPMAMASAVALERLRWAIDSVADEASGRGEIA